MLIFKAFVNDKKIDEIHIWNTGNCSNPAMGIYEYKILKPEGFEGWSIFHQRSKGYMPLVAQVTEILAKHGDNNEKT
jgi:hypothetical protein